MPEHIHESAIRKQIATESTDNNQQLQRFSDQLFDSISQGLLEDGHVRIHQFGSFKLVWARERKGRHPRTGDTIIIPAQARISFTPAKALKDQVNSADSTAVQVEPPVFGHAASSKQQTAESTASANKINAAEIEQAVDATKNHDREPATTKDRHNSLKFNRNTALAASIIIALITAFALLPFGSDSPKLKTTKQENSTENPNGAIVLQKAVSTIENDHAIMGRNEADVVHNQQSGLQHPKDILSLDPEELNRLELSQHTGQASTTGPFFTTRSHKLSHGDSLWRLSRKHYMNPFYWPHIYRANQDRIDNPNQLVMGRSINLPMMSGRPDQLTAEDRRNIAEGYFLIYRYYKKTDKPFPYFALLGVNKFDPSVIQEHIYEIDEQDWQSLQLVSN